MPRFIDFEEVKENNPIEKAIDLLHLDMRQKGNQWRGACPACKGGERTLVITPEKGVYYCFSAGKGGDVIALVAHITGSSMKDAALMLAEGTVPLKGTSTVPGTVPESGRSKEGDRTFQPLDYLEPAHDAVVAVGFDPEDAARLGIGYAKKGMMRGHVAVPIRLEDGTLVGYLGIQEAKLPQRWQFPAKVIPFSKKESA